MDETHRVLVDKLKVDGFFTDFPDLGRQAVDRNTGTQKE
jgi:glycerophosphoryl diester phosphodiesterase